MSTLPMHSWRRYWLASCRFFQLQRSQLFDVTQRLVSLLRLLVVENGHSRRLVESQDVLLQRGGRIGKLVVGQLVQQRRVGFIGQLVFACRGALAGVKVPIVQSKAPRSQVAKVSSDIAPRCC